MSTADVLSVKKRLMPWISQLITSPILLSAKWFCFRILARFNPALSRTIFYFRVNDPYSYLLLQALPQLYNKPLSELQGEIELVVLLDLSEQYYLEQAKQQQHSIADAKHLAKLYQFDFPTLKNQPSRKLALIATQLLIANAHSNNLLWLSSQVTRAFWHSDQAALASLVQQFSGSVTTNHHTSRELQSVTDKNRRRLEKSGHYLSGMLYYQGEWYWGIDRLWHLYQRRYPQGQFQHLPGQATNLDRLANDLLAQTNHSNRVLNNSAADLNWQIDFYFSFRSPYSYLAVEQIFQLAKQYSVSINIKPVLPMVMRGLKVPSKKRCYILHDAKRESLRRRIPFGKICDPLGQGVENCMALFAFASKHHRQNRLVEIFSRAIWSQGADVTNQKTLQTLSAQSGLNWQQARQSLDKQQWRDEAENNRRALLELGLWGVPCFVFKQHAFWGQDRISMLEHLFQSELSSGKIQ